MGIKESAKRQFGKQAEAYAKGNIFVDVVHLSEVVKRSGVEKNHRVLDIATGAGFLALEFAKSAETVFGCDLTRNMILKALHEMKRVCRDRLVLVDGVSSEDVEKSLFHNITHWEIRQDFEEWMKRAGADERQTKVIKDLMVQSLDGDRTGLQVRLEEERLGFTYDTVILTAQIRNIKT